jgi:hypothetical protein
MLRLPRSLHARASLLAAKECVSLNQLVVMTLSERLGGTQALAKAEAALNRRLSVLAHFVTRAAHAKSASTASTPAVAPPQFAAVAATAVTTTH